MKGSRIDEINSIRSLESLTIEKLTDPETNCDIEIRSDQVMKVYYPDSVLVLHSEGTKILRYTDGSKIIVEKQGTCPVTVRKIRQSTVIGFGGSDALLGSDQSLMERSNDGYLITTLLPDGSTMESYREKQELEGYKQTETNSIHVLRLVD